MYKDLKTKTKPCIHLTYKSKWPNNKMVYIRLVMMG